MKFKHLTAIISILLTLSNGFTSEAQEWTSEKKLIQSLNEALKKLVVPIRPLPAIKHHLTDTSDRGKPVRILTSEGNKKKPMLENIYDPSLLFDGIMPGVNLTEDQGQPNTIPYIRIAGMLEMMPLILIDGIEGDFKRLNRKDILSLEVLSNPSDIAIYGYKGRNGVLRITTRQGSPGRLTIDYSGSATLSTRTVSPEIDFRFDEWVRARQSLHGKDFNVTNSLPYSGNEHIRFPDTDWQGLLFDKAFFGTDHILRASGGNKTVSFDVSGMFSSDGGIYTGHEKYTHTTFHAGITARPFNWWKISSISDFSLMTDMYPSGMAKSGYYSLISRYGFPGEAPYIEGRPSQASTLTGHAAMHDNENMYRGRSRYIAENISNTFSIIQDRLNADLNFSGYGKDDMSLFHGAADIVYNQTFKESHKIGYIAGLELNHFRTSEKNTDYRQFMRLTYSYKNIYECSFVQSHDRTRDLGLYSKTLENLLSDSFAGKISLNLSKTGRVFAEAGKTSTRSYRSNHHPFICAGFESSFLEGRLSIAAKSFRNGQESSQMLLTKGWEAKTSWRDSHKIGKEYLMYAVFCNLWDEKINVGLSQPRYMFNGGFSVRYAGLNLKAVFQGTGRRDWLPDMDDRLFFGMHGADGKEAGLLLKNNVIKPEDLEQRTLNAAFIRLKNLQLEYSYSSPRLEKHRISRIVLFCEGRNLFYISAMQDAAPFIDPEMIYPGTSTGAGDKYPLLRTIELGLRIVLL